MFLNKSLCFQWKHFSRNKGQKTLYGLVGLHKVFYRKCLRCQFSMETGQPFTKRGTCRCCPGLWLALFCMVWSLEVKQFQTVKEGRAVANVFRQWQNFDFDGSLESFQDWYFEFMFFFGMAWQDRSQWLESMRQHGVYGIVWRNSNDIQPFDFRDNRRQGMHS